MTVWVGLLRGINVGGRNRVPMTQLREVAEVVGLSGVATYIQSGNLVFESEQSGTQIAADLSAGIEDATGLTIPVTLRDREAFRSIAESHPFAGEHVDERFLAVAFFDRRPVGAVEAALPVEEFAPDRYSSNGLELFIHYPTGSARSRLGTDVIDRRLGVVSTIRNWRTVRRISEMLDA